MDTLTKNKFILYYALMSDEDLAQCKADIGKLLKTTKVSNLDDIKENITIINAEIKSRLDSKNG